jgi:hypothetical protein
MQTISLGDINLLDIGNNIQIAGTIWSGNDTHFVTLFPDKKEDFLDLKVMPLSLDEWLQILKQTDILETEIFAKDPTGRLVKTIFRKTQRQIDSYVQWAVFQRDQYSCRYCGRTGIPLTVDHVDLWENGGASIVINLLSACKSCNKDRGNMEYDAWISSNTYKNKSKNLSETSKQANLAVITLLPELRSKRVVHVRSR